MEYEFDEEGWIESLMTCEAAQHFAEEAIFQAIYAGLSMRDRTWITEGIGFSVKQKEWRDAKAQKALAVYRRLQLRLPYDTELE